LLAGAIRTIKWDVPAEQITGKLHNFYNYQDKILKREFSHFGIYKYKPCGIHPIKSELQNIENHDITAVMNTPEHDLRGYLKALSVCNFF
jgi:hypothetical protein